MNNVSGVQINVTEAFTVNRISKISNKHKLIDIVFLSVQRINNLT